MKNEAGNFIPAAQVAIHDAEQRAAVAFGAGSGFAKRQAAMFAAGEAHGQALRQQAAAIRRHSLNHLPDLLARAEEAMTANGIRVLWARDAVEAISHVIAIARRHNIRSVVKSKSMVTEEIGLNVALEAAGLTVLESGMLTPAKSLTFLLGLGRGLSPGGEPCATCDQGGRCKQRPAG